MKKSLRCFLSRFFALALLGYLPLAGGGCASEPAEPAYSVSILFEAAPGFPIGQTQQVTLPVSQMNVNVVVVPELVEMRKILDLQMAEAGEPDLRHLCFVAYVNGDAFRTLNRFSLKGKGRRLFLRIGDDIVGVHPVTATIESGVIFFISEIPGQTQEEQVATMTEYMQGGLRGLVEVRKAAERR